MVSKRPKFGFISDKVMNDMTEDYIVNKKTLKEISKTYQIALSTVGLISKNKEWKKRRTNWDNKSIKKATTLRAHSANKIIGWMMDILERHSYNLFLKSKGITPKNHIPIDTVEEAYKAMGYMDKIATQIKSARENLVPEKIEIDAPGLNWENAIKELDQKQIKGIQQLQEWEASRNPAIKEKESEDIFDAQTPLIDGPKDEGIIFEGLDEDSESDINDVGDDSPIGGILD